VPLDSEEPVAAVARALAPSVVQIESNRGLGSGVVYDAEQGLILTAAHVVTGVEQTTVVLSDGTRLSGTVVGADDGTDVGVVQVDHEGLVPAPLNVDEPLQVGQMAIAIGSPFGLDGSVTAGVISAPRRAVTGPDGRTRTMIQTDAAINPGNSGGALADRNGRVVGINDLIFSQSGGNEGIGFAIPIDVAMRSADALLAGEPIEAGYLGITGTAPETGRSGALVTGVLDGSAADSAGVRVGDLIISVDGVPVTSTQELAAAVQAEPPGTEVTLELVRGDETITLTVVLDVRPESG
jgi:S1-C subfamily serine protease